MSDIKMNNTPRRRDVRIPTSCKWIQISCGLRETLWYYFPVYDAYSYLNNLLCPSRTIYFHNKHFETQDFCAVSLYTLINKCAFNLHLKCEILYVTILILDTFFTIPFPKKGSQ